MSSGVFPFGRNKILAINSKCVRSTFRQSEKKKQEKVAPQIMTSYNRIANKSPVYTNSKIYANLSLVILSKDVIICEATFFLLPY